MNRTDIHRPSIINPEDYEFVCMQYQKDELLGAVFMESERIAFNEHMARTGGKFSNHEHGGTCMVCGANAIYTVLFYHEKTNTYVSMGTDCAEKCEIGDPARFRTFRTQVHDVMERRAGKAKAQLLLKEWGLEQAWVIYEATTKMYQEYPGQVMSEEQTIHDIIEKLIKYGTLSEKQISYAKYKVERISTRGEREARYKAEKEAALPCPTGRVQITGEVVKVTWVDTIYGKTQKMTVKANEGFLVYGTVPASLEEIETPDGRRAIQHGDKIQFTATVKPSDKDVKFGFFKRPTQGSVI